MSSNHVKKMVAPVDSMEAWGRLEPDGVYDVTRTYEEGKVLLIDKHLERLENSARSEGINPGYQRQDVRPIVAERLLSTGFGPSRLRFCVGREQPDELIITLEEIGPMAAILAGMKKDGVCVDIERIARRNPSAKTNDWVRERNRVQAEKPSPCYERLIVSEEGELLEGFSSNFFTIRDGEIFTAEEGRVLPGIARVVVLESSRGICDVNLSAARLDEIESFDEAFMTSSGRGIVPVTRIGEQTLGDGRPGPLTVKLMVAYDAWAADNLEAL